MVLDVICLICILFGGFIGFSRGIISTFFSVFSIVIGAIAASKFGPFVGKAMEQNFSNENPLWYFAGILLTFVVTLLAIRLFARGFEGILQTVHVNFINQILGGIITAGFFMLFFSVIVKFCDQARLITDKTKTESLCYPYTIEFPEHAYTLGEKVKPVFLNFWNQTLDVMDRLEDQSISKTSSETEIYNIEDDREPSKKPKEITYEPIEDDDFDK